MKKIIPILFTVLSGFLFSSCEENFSPKTDYKEKYILTFLVRADTSFQVATLSKSYNVSEYNPFDNHTDPALTGADIKIWYKDEVYTMKDTVMPRKDSSRYASPVHYYYLKNFKPAASQPLEVLVELNNGKKLSAATKVPRTIDFVITDKVPAADKNTVMCSWRTYDTDVWYMPRLLLCYYKGNSPLLTKQVPVKYSKENGRSVPRYPVITSENSVTFELAAIDSVMEQISAGNPQKGQYKIAFMRMEVYVMDNFLSSYYATSHGYLDDYSVRLDQADFTNIQGGLGIFASYYKQGIGLIIEKKYIQKFGYVPSEN